MKIKVISSGTRIRNEHNTGGAIINSYSANTECEGDTDWISSADVYNSSNVMINMAGDRWLFVNKVNGVSIPVSGWVAITHKGQPICDVIEENVEIPPPIDNDPYVKAILITASGKEEVWLPQA